MFCAAGAGFVDPEELVEEVENFPNEADEAALMAHVGAFSRGVGWSRVGGFCAEVCAAGIALAVVVFVGVTFSRGFLIFVRGSAYRTDVQSIAF